MSADQFDANGQPVPPQPDLPSCSEGSPAFDPLPPPEPDAAAVPANEGQPSSTPDAGHGFGADPAADTPRNEAEDQAADDSGFEASVDSGDDPFSFDPDAYVNFGDGDAEAGCAAWNESRRALLDAFRREAEVREASGGPPYLGWFSDEAIPSSNGRYRFGIDREQLLAAVTHLGAAANRPKGSKPIVRIALRPDLCKLSVVGPQYGFAAIALSLAEAATGFEDNPDPVAFTMPVPKLADIVQTSEPGVPVRLEFISARGRLLVHGRHDYRRVPTFVPNRADQPLISTPKPVRVLDPASLAQGLSLLKHVIRKPEDRNEPASWSRAYVRDGMVFGHRDGVLGVVQSASLAGLETMVHIASISAVSTMVRRMDGNTTGHFVTERHTLLTDEQSWLALETAADVPFEQPTILEYLLRRVPTDEILVPFNELLSEIDRCVAATKGEPGARLVRLRVKNVGPWARLVLRSTDQPQLHHGFAKLECYRTRKLNTAGPAKDIDMHIKVKPLRDLVSYFGNTFEISNIVLDALPALPAFPRPVLRLRYEAEGSGGCTATVFLIGTP